MSMMRNYFKIAVRNIIKQKIYSLIIILGLAVGMSCAILIFLWVQDELRYDRFHANADELYLVKLDQKYVSNVISSVTTTPGALGPALQKEYPEIVNFSRSSSIGKVLLRYDEKVFFESRLGLVDPSLFEMFSFPFVKGNPKTALSSPHNIVLTEEMAKKYFGPDEPMGKTIKMNNRYSFIVTGVLKDIPKNSSIRYDFFVPLVFLRELGSEIDQWKNDRFRTYVLLDKNVSFQRVNEKIALRLQREYDTRAEVFLSPFSDWHLHVQNDGAAFLFVIILSVVALLSLIIACINFINLSTARSANRAREIGLRKVLGADRWHLIKQFLGESLFITFISGIFSILLVQFILPAFNNLSKKQLSFDFSDFSLLMGIIGIIIFTGLVSGSYPALYLSSFQPAAVFKGSVTPGSRKGLSRKMLVVTQFSVSVILILTTMVAFRQFNYINEKDLGFDKSNLVYIPMQGDLAAKYEIIKSKLLQESGILSVTRGAELPTWIRASGTGWEWEGKDNDEQITMSEASVGFDYFETLDLKMAMGRPYSREYPTDKTEAIIVNEEALKLMNMEAPIGKRLSIDGNNYRIIGVVKNYHYKPIFFKIKPLVIRLKESPDDFIFVRINPGNASRAMAYIEEVYQTFNPGYPFEYGYVDEENPLFLLLQPLGDIMLIFTLLAIFVSCLGLLGLTAFITQQKTKEIGIRKVLGATVPHILRLLTVEFGKWVVLANVIAWPLAYLIMKLFLGMFAYRVSFTFFIFLLAGVLSLLVALLTTSFQTIKASTRNPIYSLKYE